MPEGSSTSTENCRDQTNISGDIAGIETSKPVCQNGHTPSGTAKAIPPISAVQIADIVRPLTSSTPTLPNLEEDLSESSHLDTPLFTHSVSSPLGKIMASSRDSPPSREVDALTDLLFCSPQLPSIPLSAEVSAIVSSPHPADAFKMRPEDIEGHKSSTFHSYHPLQSAHKKRRGSSTRKHSNDSKQSTGRSKHPQRKKKTDSVESSGKETAAEDSLVIDQNGGDSQQGFLRGQGVPAASGTGGDTVKIVQFAPDESVFEKSSIRLGPISEENVKFSIGTADGIADESADDDVNQTPSLSARKISRHHQVMLQMGLPDRPSSDSLSKRQVPGDKVLQQQPPSSANSEMHLQLEDDDEFKLPEVDHDRAHSHRLDYLRPTHKIKRPSSAISSTGVGVSFLDHGDGAFHRHPVDHTSHDVFVELDELVTVDGGMGYQWKEKARWIKYEEDVELGGEWGKPHVSTLSFHSLLELRKLLEQGVALFDMPETSLGAIVHRICVALRERGTLKEEEAHQMEIALNGRHSHQSNMRKNFSALAFNHTPTMSKKSSVSFHHPNNEAPSDYEKKKDHSCIKADFEEASLLEPEEGGNTAHLSTSVDYAAAETHPFLKESSLVIDGPNVSFSRSASQPQPASRKTSVFSNLMSLGSHHVGTAAQTDIEKRVPEGAEVANVWVGSVDFLQSPIMVFVRLAQGVLLSEVSEVRMPMRFIFILMGPVTRHMFIEDYREIGRAMSTLMSYKDFREACYVANEPKDLVAPMNAFLDGSVVVPAHGWNKGNVVQMLDDIRSKMIQVDKQRKRKRQRGDSRRDSKSLKKGDEDEEGDELARSGRCLDGIIRDMKRRYPLYLSDITDALNFQCFSVIIFIFFAVLTPSITFGADVELERVNSWMGVYETILGSALTGALFGLLSGQPLLIIGCTGPLAVFEGSLYDVAESVSEKNYMAFRCWVGLWMALICVLTAVLQLSFVLKYFTRFAEEIFAMLVSLIFCVSVINSLVQIFRDHPLELSDECLIQFRANKTYLDECFSTSEANKDYCTNHSIFHSVLKDTDYCCELPSSVRDTPNTALLSLILTCGCFIIAYFLKLFRSSPFFSPHVRKALGDFGVPIAILAMTSLDLMLKDKIYTKKLNFPEKFEPTKNADSTEFSRDWLISPFDLEQEYWWMALAACIPAILCFFLIFIEIQITARILDKKEHNLEKGTGYHLNMVMIGVTGVICGVLGCPFVTGATVRSVSHTSALIVTDPHHAPGEKPKQKVIEQRVTAVMVNLLLGLSVLLKSVLSYVPYSVLYGVFFYMGIACLGSLQFYDRIKLMFMARNNYPSVAYVRDVSSFKTHVFTVIQILVVAVLWAVKESPLSILFPFFLILLVPVRFKLLPLLYTEVELSALDSEEVDVYADHDDADYNLTAHMPY